MEQTIQKLKNKIEELELKSGSNSVTTTTNNTNSNNTSVVNYQHNNIYLKSFGNESIEHIQEDVSFLTSCIKNLRNDGMRNLVERIHFDPNHPENHNSKIKSTKNKTCDVYQNNRWIVMDKNETLDMMMEKGYKILVTFYNNNDDIKETDMNSNESRLYFLLSKIGRKEKPTYCPIRKKVYALMLSNRHGVMLEGSSNIEINDPNITLLLNDEDLTYRAWFKSYSSWQS